MVIQVDKLRSDMMDYYGTASFNGFPVALAELSKIESMTDEELVRYAMKKGIPLEKYACEAN